MAKTIYGNIESWLNKYQGNLRSQGINACQHCVESGEFSEEAKWDWCCWSDYTASSGQT